MQTAAFLIVTFLLTANTSFALISVKTEQFVNAECGDEVMLTCSIEDNLSLKDYYWSKNLKELCSYKDTEKVLPGTKCENVDDQKLVLTIYDVHPNNSAIYTCKVKADSDHGFNNSNLHVSDCIKEKTERSDKVRSEGINHGCSTGNKLICFLLSLTAGLLLVLDSGI